MVFGMRPKEQGINLSSSLLDDMKFRYKENHFKNFDEKRQ